MNNSAPPQIPLSTALGAAAGLPTVVLAEDCSVLRDGLRALLRSSERFRLLDGADERVDVGRLLEALKPDVVILDLSLPATSGLPAIREIKQRAPRCRVLVLSVDGAEPCVRAAFQFGADGYVLKSSPPGELLEGIQAILSGRRFVSAALSEHIVNRYLEAGGPSRTAYASMKGLTRREREVLRMIAGGRRNREIAADLAVSVKTVEKHRSNLMNKLDLHNTAALTSFAFENRLLGSGEFGFERPGGPAAAPVSRSKPGGQQ